MPPALNAEQRVALTAKILDLSDRGVPFKRIMTQTGAGAALIKTLYIAARGEADYHARAERHRHDGPGNRHPRRRQRIGEPTDFLWKSKTPAAVSAQEQALQAKVKAQTVTRTLRENPERFSVEDLATLLANLQAKLREGSWRYAVGQQPHDGVEAHEA
jgi:hypothetical protein